MEKLKIIVLLLVILPQISIGQTEAEIREARIINIESEIVGKLTGRLPIKGKKVLKSRHSASERKIVANYLSELIEEIGLKTKRNEYNVRTKKGAVYDGVNIYTEIPSTNGSDEYVIISAHYDTVEGSPGAVHNATGIAIAHYVASQLMELDYRGKNFLIVYFDHWKSNMVGVRKFTQFLKEEGYNIHSMHRSDFMGWDNDEDRAIEMIASNISLESKYRIESPVPIYKRTISTPESRFFAKFGYETVTLTAELRNADNSPFVRQSEDKYTTVNFKYLASTTEIVYNVMRSFALE